MKRMKSLVRLLLVLSIVSVQYTAVYAGDTTGALPYLRMGVGSRALAMGGAFTAISDDASSAYWNPAGLANVESKEILTMYGMLSLGRNFNWINFVMPMASGGLSVGLINSGVSGIDAYNENDIPAGSFDYMSNTLLVSYGKKMEDKVSVGANLKIISDSLKDSSRTGFGIDVAVITKPADKVSLGLKLQDLIGTVGSDTIPLSISVGMAYKMYGDSLVLSADANKVSEIDSPKLRVGMEYLINEKMSVQTGVNDGNFSFGASFGISMFNLAYGYVTDPFKTADRHLLSFGVKF